MAMSNDPAIATVAPKAPVTAQRPVRSDLQSSIPKPYLARAMAAPDMDHPDGTPDHKARGMSVLQQHVAFFDKDNDGIVYPWETYEGLRAIGFNQLFALIFALGFNVTFSFPTLPSFIPSLLLPVYIDNIHKGKHPSDTGAYDTEGRYMPVNFENMLSKYGKKASDKLTLKELWDMTEGNRLTYDFVGWILAKLKWGAVYFIAKDKEGNLSKEAMRGVFDGSLFENLAKKNADEAKKRA